MTHPPHDTQQRDEVLLFGTVTASVTHELSNALSIIDQSAGLLEDLVAGLASGGAISPERLKIVHGRIMRQVERGVDVVRRLNRFAHSADERLVEFDAREEIENTVFLARRFAELRKIRLETAFPDEEIRMTTDLFAVQHAVFRCIQEVLDLAAEGGRIVVQARGDGDIVRVAVGGSIEGLEEGNSQRADRLRLLMKPIHGESGIGTTDGGDPALVLRLPRNGPPRR